MKKSVALCLALFLSGGAAALAADTPLYKDSSASARARAEDLLKRMTTEEKFAQLRQSDGLWDDGAYTKEQFELAGRGLLGSTLNVRRAKNVNELQKIAVEGSRLGIPVLFAFDVIHGYRTIFPVPLGEAAQWDAESVEKAAALAAREAASTGLKWTFAPMVDIARDPRWGRIVEGSGEDPYLGSALAAARVRGFQGDDFSKPDKLLACAKHWVGYGAAEGGRDYNTTDISDFMLQNIYYPPFKAAVDAGVATFMSAFNDLNGVPASGNRHTMQDILRGAWKFNGFVVSDYTSVQELVAHEYAADGEDAVVKALGAGVDMEMVSTLYTDKGPGLLAKNRLSLETLDAAVRRVLEMKFKAGIFEHPYVDPTREAAELLKPENRKAAEEAAAKS
ncbi:MAG: glycoside hydrolase family 3 N-terminal domain-containing protein, partial [Elusimicrobiales bacterium]|nr:glycoside hydrolase family 3 N-terminal domain-containing protein [Elusimicrobiales bacterium]